MLTPTLRISGQQTQFTTVFCCCVATYYFSASDTTVVLVVDEHFPWKYRTLQSVSVQNVPSWMVLICSSQTESEMDPVPSVSVASCVNFVDCSLGCWPGPFHRISPETLNNPEW